MVSLTCPGSLRGHSLAVQRLSGSMLAMYEREVARLADGKCS